MQHTGYTPMALYARGSSDRPGDGPVRGRADAELRGYTRKNGYSVAREYIDEADSGRVADSPEFQKMIDECWQTARMGQFGTREIRDRMEVL